MEEEYLSKTKTQFFFSFPALIFILDFFAKLDQRSFHLYRRAAYSFAYVTFWCSFLSSRKLFTLFPYGSLLLPLRLNKVTIEITKWNVKSISCKKVIQLHFFFECFNVCPLHWMIFFEWAFIIFKLEFLLHRMKIILNIMKEFHQIRAFAHLEERFKDINLNRDR